MRLSRAGVRAVASVAVLVTSVATLTGSPALAAPAPPRPPAVAPDNPTDGQISAAQSAKNALAARVGALTAQIASAQATLQQLEGRLEMAEQQVAFAVSKQRDAQDAADRAQARLRATTATVAGAHTRFVQYLQASYMDGQPDGTAGSLLTAHDPTALLDQGALEQFQAENKIDAIGTFQRASVAKSNAEAAARASVAKLRLATAAAKTEQEQVDGEVQAERAAQASLRATMAANQTSLSAAQLQLATLDGQRAQYVAYQKQVQVYQAYQAHQAYLAEQRRIAQARQAAAARHRQQVLAAQERAREQAAAKRRHDRSSGDGSTSGSGNDTGSDSSSSTPITVQPPAPSGGSWSAAKGRLAVRRAMSWLGEDYAWAGGGASGPSRGVCDASNGAPNDCNVIGFDCSGLAMYAWGPYVSMDHYALRQYSEAGSMHPSIGNLEPGDLLFYSFNGSVSGIHHVAIYAGNGEIVQAPYSGGFVEVSSMYGPGSIFGATRPLT